MSETDLNASKPDDTVSDSVPKHIAIIMDGNGRWAQRQGLPRVEGHRRGASTVQRITEKCAAIGVEVLTLYCFSSENWKRPAEELDFLMQLLELYLVEQRSAIVENGLRLEMIGRRDRLPPAVLAELQTTQQLCRSHTGMRLVLAVDYGGRAEITQAVRQIIDKVDRGQLQTDQIDEAIICEHLYTAGMPDPDLLIRTGGDMRISNFLLWQISYSELWVTQRSWPDFSETDLLDAIHDYQSRHRRFGGL